MKERGDVRPSGDPTRFPRRHHLKMIPIQHLIEYRRKNEKLVNRVVTAKLPTKYGTFALHLYEDELNKEHHLAIVHGVVAGQKKVLVRVPSSCFIRDTFVSLPSEFGPPLLRPLRRYALARPSAGSLMNSHDTSC